MSGEAEYSEFITEEDYCRYFKRLWYGLRTITPEQEALARLESMAGTKKGDLVPGDRYYENRQMPVLSHRPSGAGKTVDGDDGERVSLDEYLD